MKTRLSRTRLATGERVMLLAGFLPAAVLLFERLVSGGGL